jgi:hypothetical protein
MPIAAGFLLQGDPAGLSGPPAIRKSFDRTFSKRIVMLLNCGD